MSRPKISFKEVAAVTVASALVAGGAGIVAIRAPANDPEEVLHTAQYFNLSLKDFNETASFPITDYYTYEANKEGAGAEVTVACNNLGITGLEINCRIVQTPKNFLRGVK